MAKKLVENQRVVQDDGQVILEEKVKIMSKLQVHGEGTSGESACCSSWWSGF
jgi:hypothetical protein